MSPFSAVRVKQTNDSTQAENALPLSPAQQRLWFLAQMDGVSEAYHLPLCLRLSGELDRPALKRALDRIVQRHATLRASFKHVGGGPAQRVALVDKGFELQEHDLSSCEEAEIELERMTRKEAGSRFDLEHGPLIRGQLICLAEQEHMLLITMHQIISDIWSVGVLTNELSALYRAYHTGEEDPLPPPAMQYAEYALSQQQRLSGEVLQRESEFWRRTLEGAPPLLKLPTDRPRPAEQTLAGDVVELHLGSALTQELKALCQRHDMTLSMLVVAGWAAVLSRLSAQEEVVIGVAVPNRVRPETEGLIGSFANTLALRVEASGTVAELLQKVKAGTFNAQQHQELPFEQVVEIVKPPRSLTHAPIFQVMLVWQGRNREPLHLPGLKLIPEHIAYGAGEFDLDLGLGESGDGIMGGLRYATALFDHETVERHADYLRRVLAAMVTDEDQAVDRIDLLSDAECDFLLKLGDGGPSIEAIPGSGESCLFDLLAAQAERSPQAIALIDPGEEVTYRQLIQRANGLGRHLSELGIGPEAKVAILTDRSAEAIIGVLGILAAGAAYVPLDPSYPDERISFILEDASAQVLLTPAALVERARNVAQCTALKNNVVVIATAPTCELRPNSTVTSANAAYVIYTSGSTGAPKGVVIDHRGAVNMVQGFIARHNFAGHRLLMIPPLIFDASVGDIFPALAVGATIALHPAPAELGWLELEQFCREVRITGIDAPAALWHRWTEGFAAYMDINALLPDLTLMMIGGESVSLEQVRRFAQLTGNRVVLANHYGPTEASVCATILITRDGSELSGTDLPIGRPLPGVRVYVLDQYLRLTSRGAAGELYIAGVGVAREYLRLPELSAERFVRDPFSPDPTARMYRTGDLASWNADGTLQFIGRLDHQVKIRGLRIELGEIEARLAEHPSVHEAVVLAREHHPGDKRLVAYVTPAGVNGNGAGTAAMDVQALRSHLSTCLPEHMVPAAYVTLEKLPLTRNGKLDRKALPSPDASAYVTHEYEAPVGGVENAVARIWAEVLKLERVGRNDNFFELGGHSLLAVSVIERMRAAGLSVDVRTLFVSPTLKGLAEAVGGESREVLVPFNLIPEGCTAITPEMLPLVNLSQSNIDRIVVSVPGGAENIRDIYPLAPLQEGLLFHHLLEKEGDVYLMTKLLAAQNRERLDRYVDALQAVIDRHDILRTSVAWEGLPEPVQVVWRHARLSIEEVILDPAAGDIAEQLRARFNPRHYRLDVRQAPLFRWFIAEDKLNNRWLILELMHHLIGDQMTSLVMQQEIQTILEGQAERLSVPLPFRNFVVQARVGVSREDHEEFFTRILGDVDEPTAPFGLTDVQGDGSQIVEVRREVDFGLSQRLRAEARKLGVTLASLCHVAWAVVLARTSGLDDVVFGTVMSGRMHGSEGSDRGLGIFINTLPLRIHVSDESVQATVRNTHALLTQLLRHEHAPLGLAQRCSAVRPPAPLFTSLLNYRHVAVDEAVIADGLVTFHGNGQSPETHPTVKPLGEWERTNYPFSLSVNDLGQELGLEVKVDRSIDPQQVCAMAHTALESLVMALERDPAAPVCRLDVLPHAERQRLLVEWNATEAEYSREKCVHELFEEQVEKTPEAAAVVFEDVVLSYGELNRRANQLAHYLRELGVRPDGRVAICLERSPKMIVALLAVWKAGGAYVPLDLAYPVERLNYMLEHSAPAVMLTQKDLPGRFERLNKTLQVVDLTDAAHPWSVWPDTNPNHAGTGVTPESLAYVIYTSGSTGLSKGVMVSHQSVVNLFFGLKNSVYSALRAGCWRVSVNGSMAFDTSVKQIIQLLDGHALDIVPEAVRRDGEALLQFLRDRKIEVFDCTPSQLHLLLEAGLIREKSDSHVEHPSGPANAGNLRLVLVGGESIEMSMWERLGGSEISFFNVYGPTECTVDASVCAVRPGVEPSIGRPIANTALYVLDEDLNPVPAGVPGELYIGGHGVARGYWNDPETTAQKFIADPFSSAPGARLYRTGDRVRRLLNGNLAFSGRIDNQVKVRGYRIELGEIEMRLAEHPSVNEAVVLAREDHAGGKRLVAYVTTTGSKEDGAAAAAMKVEALRTHLGSLVPEYMVPAAYVRLEKLPLTPNGKVDRKALSPPDADAYMTRGYEAPVGKVETTVARIWAEVLKLERVGRNDNFFELGGHSLVAVTVIERMREAGLMVDVRVLFASPTPKGLAEAIGGESKTVVVPPNLIPAGGTSITPDMLPLVTLSQSDIEKIVAAVPGGAANVQDIYPLAPLQEGILFHHLLNTQGDVYLLAILRTIESREDVDRYVEALQAVIDRHDILRTAVVWEGLPEPLQVVRRNAPLSVEEVRLDPAAGDVGERLRARFSPRHYRVDVREAPLWRLFIAEDVPNNRWVILDLMHHLISDHVTLQIIRQEIRTILRGEAGSLPAPLPFRNFVAQARLGISREEHEDFFTRILGDVDEPTAPFGLTDVQGDGSRIVDAVREVDRELCQRLRRQARKLGVNLASACHLGWALVLARCSGREDVVFGTVLFGRMQGGEGADRALGIFINTLPVRIRVAGETARASVRQTHELLTQLLRHEHASLVLAQRCSGVRAPAPLFTSLFNYRHEVDGESVSMGGDDTIESRASMEVLGGQERNNYPFALAVNDLGEGISIEVKVDRSVDPQQVCAWMHTALESLAQALESDPDIEVRRLEVLPASEREQLVYGWNQTHEEHSPDKCIHVLFEEQVKQTPRLRAVASQREALSYQELNRRANQLGHYLRRLGVRPDERVAICMGRGVEMVAGLLGIMKAGAAYLGLESGYPGERLRYMIEDAGVRIVLTQQSLAEKLRASGARLVFVDDEAHQARIAEESQRNLKPVTAMENLVYVIYTSGSTGKPKGVGIEHRQLVNYVRGISRDLEELGLGTGAKYALVSTLSADLGNTAIFPSLLNGGELHVIGEDLVMDGKRLGEYFEREKIDCLKIVPSHLAGLRRAKGGERVLPRKVLVAGGEASSWPLVREWTTASQCVVINHYGPTETTVGAVRFRVAKEAIEEDGIVPIGQPLGNVRLYVLDKQMQLVPVGASGELYIGGAGVGRGYVDRAELTAERFVPDPFFAFGQRLYRTGDLVRRRKDGNIEFLGRIDQQVKIRGFRIELGEIEAALREQPEVEQAAVMAVEGESGSKRLVAYLIAASLTEDGSAATRVDVESLRVRLGSLLPDYMVPAAYVVLKEFPLNANGKLDRKRLPAPDAGAYLIREYEAPMSVAEIVIARIWAEVFKLERVGRNDNFFELGGHSLLAITVIERMREANLTVNVSDLFTFPTLKGLAEATNRESHEIVVPPNLISAGCTAITPAMLPLISVIQSDIDSIVATVRGGAANVKDIYPLAPLQEGILFHHLLEKEGDVYLSATLLGAASRERLDRYVAALQIVVDRHDILRTGFVWEGLPEPVQVVWRNAPLKVEEVRLDPADGDIAKQLRARFNPRHYRLDVRETPLWRLFIAEDVPNNRWVILELKHHLTGDNTTGKFLLSEVQMILQGDVERLTPPLPFRNFVAQARLGVSREEHETFFTRMLGDVDEPTAPFGLTNVQGNGSQIVEGHRNVGAELIRRLRTQTRALGVTVASLCHLAWALVLARTSGRDDVVFGTVLFGRMQGGEVSDRGLGIFINTLPVRIRVGGEGVRAGARHTHELLTQLFRHEHASLTLVQRCSSVQATAPLFTSLFNYRHLSQEAGKPEDSAEALIGLKFLESKGRTNYPFGLYIDDLEQDLHIEAQVEGSIDPLQVCALMHAALESIVQALESSPERALRTLPVLPEQERQQVLYGWNATEAAYPHKCLHELFEEQVVKTPEATALMFENQSLNYAELNRRANRLAYYLRGLGVKADERVGVCAERGIEMVVALLAVLKAGGAYMPLDPEYPEERLQYMLRNSGPVAVLTEANLQERVKAMSTAAGQESPVIDLTAAILPWQEQAETNPGRGEIGLAPERLAYVIYTSGSTGTPKGVMIEHRSIVNRLIWMQSAYALEAEDAILQKTPFSFDVSVWEFFWPLLAGARLVMARPGGHKDPRYLCETIEKNRITTLHFVPSMLHAFLEHGEAGRCSSVRQIMCSGEALSAAVARRCRELLPWTNLHNLYGPTEAAVDVTAWTYPANTGPETTIPIGRPIANTQMYILGRNLEPMPVGVTGELYIGGVQVGRGYLNREDLTSERFIKDPFAKEVEARMYRTGDVGRWLADGNIEYLGRNDFQVKIRGFRIELGEIESRLLEHRGVREAAVVAREDNPGEQRLVAYYVGTDQTRPDAEQLRRHLAPKLPEYMVPAAYVCLETLPLSANGKLDRKALPSPDVGAYLTREYEAPQGETETTLAAIWTEVLKLNRIGRNDNFFEMGGHSLLAMQLINRIRVTLGVDVQLRDIFAASTIKNMATAVSVLASLNEALSDAAASHAGRYL
jgi:amino acid adenylation domain-containing protein